MMTQSEIKATDLRIGNWVKVTKTGGYNNVGDIIQVSSIGFRGINDWQDMGASGCNTFDGIEPIALTPEILKKAGFKQGDDVYNSSSDISYPCYYIFRIQIALTEDGYRRWVEIEDAYYSYASTRIKYLHQLQNLFYCLCGEELKVNLH